jgi:hypothetical protein
MKKYTYYLHVNKQKQTWTVHGSKGCFHFNHVSIEVPCETVHLPHKKDNPRFFVKVRGILVLEGDYARII